MPLYAPHRIYITWLKLLIVCMALNAKQQYFGCQARNIGLMDPKIDTQIPFISLNPSPLFGRGLIAIGGEMSNIPCNFHYKMAQILHLKA